MLESITGKQRMIMIVFPLKFKPVVNKLKYISLWGILLSSLSLIGCEPSAISIAQISDRKIGKNAYITGKVVHLAPFVDNAAYQLEDTTGKIWIVTTNTPPKLGQDITIKSKISYQSLPLEEQELGDFYLVELERLKLPIDDSN